MVMERVPLFIEIGSEEIPAGYIDPALEAMKEQIIRFMDDYRIKHGTPLITGTPRRLVLFIPDVAIHQEGTVQEIIGPPYQVAFNPDGTPTKAAEGFAKSQKVSIEELQIKETPKGKYLYVLRREEGLPTKELLAEKLPDFIAHIPFPKSMRWGNETVTFARPIRWIVALLGNEIIPFRYGDIESGRFTYGHRFMSPDPIEVLPDYERYRNDLRRAFVIVDQNERRELILSAIKELASKVEGYVIEDEDLLAEVTHLVEYPYPLMGRFEEKYLELPPEVPITVMKEHQRYFAVTDKRGRLMPYFITVANTIARDSQVVIKGNERVIRARLEDARFYYEEDQKVPLDQRAEQLKTVVFHSKLGTSWEKVERFTEIAKFIAERLDLPSPEREKLLRAAHLCKADLVTGMVSEFPELQGIMGRDYALKQGEAPDVAQAIYEHYLPTRAGGAIPEGIIGAILSIADKLDTIVGCFSVGMIPTGTADPFALRRQTLGIIRIISEKKLFLSIVDLIKKAIPLLKRWATEPEEEVFSGVMNFFKGRLEHMLTSLPDSPYTPNAVRAALAVRLDVIPDDIKKIEALSKFTQKPDFESLATAFKRVVNIIRDELLESAGKDVRPELFREPQEENLWKAFVKCKEKVISFTTMGQYIEALEALAELKSPIDAFFDSVLVMAKEEEIRQNRLSLLRSIKELFEEIADFRML
ncbi:MAG: glycine--tRNA ligase subunit beta [Syntrophobacterales bacterium]|nr:glycine--tRNA ligase subunit beta [Syntrophobacterales bacterium]